MKTKYIIMGLVGLCFIAITTWSPWLSNDEVDSIVRKRQNFIENNDNLPGYDSINDVPLNIMYAPFGRWTTTVEGGWYVGFWHGV